MRLSELHPEYGAVDAESYPGRFWLMFDCQASPGKRVYVQFHRAPPQPGVWQCTSEWKVWHGLEHLGPLPSTDNLTLSPSISDHAHGRGPRCMGHVSIVDGEVIPS